MLIADHDWGLSHPFALLLGNNMYMDYNRSNHNIQHYDFQLQLSAPLFRIFHLILFTVMDPCILTVSY